MSIGVDSGSATAAAGPSDSDVSTSESIFASKFSPTLAAHLRRANGRAVDVDALSRTTPERLAKTALPQIGLIELVGGEDFAQRYESLYVAAFPRRHERERTDLIVDRLVAQARKERKGLAPFRVVGIRDLKGEVIGAAHFSVLSLGEDGDSSMAVPYLQYIYVRPQNRRQNMSEVLHTMVLAVATADAQQKVVPFTLFETEPPDYEHRDGPDVDVNVASRAYARERSKIHTSSGGVALVLKREGDDNQEILSAHVQPGLEPGDPPLTLVWVIRPSPNLKPLGPDHHDHNDSYNIQTVGPRLLAAYYQSLRDEGFPEENIRLAERMVEHRRKGSVFHLMPLADVRDFTDQGHLDTYSAD